VYVTVKELRKPGVVFEEDDVLGVKTVDGVAEHASGARGAWFKNLDGNICRSASTVTEPYRPVGAIGTARAAFSK
jgi:hypothetical protein